jgi:hypothetical protein
MPMCGATSRQAQFLRSLLDDGAAMLLDGREILDVGPAGGEKTHYWRPGGRAREAELLHSLITLTWL